MTTGYNPADWSHYSGWVKQHREAAIARGGKTLRPPSSANERSWRRARSEGREHLHPLIDRKPGEIVNPITGEVVTKCLTISKLAEQRGLTSGKLTDHMVTMGLVHRVVTWRPAPMVCVPELRKPQYDHRPEATQWAVEEGYLIPVTFNKKDGFEVRRVKMVLITPDGQKLLADKIGKRAGKVSNIVKHLVLDGNTQAEIVRLTGFTKQLVSYHIRRLQAA